MITDTRPSRAELVALYDSVGWSLHTAEPEKLEQAVERSSYVRTIYQDGQLIGLCRALSDGYVLCYLLDLLVHPTAQGKGLGKQLLHQCLEDHAEVRQFVLLTDDRPQQLALYQGAGLANLRDLKRVKLNTFLRIRGAELI